MGIHGLGRYLLEKAPCGVKELNGGAALTGRVMAVDASTNLYAFLVAIRDSENYASLTNESGEATSHISGMLSRCIKLLEMGIKPVYVFDGKPPELKGGELAKRRGRKDQADLELEEARDAGDEERVKQLAGRTVRVTKKHNEDVQKLLTLMGVPVVQAPSEAEGQCAALCKAGLAYGTISEDSDTLCFGTPYLIKNLTSTDKKRKVLSMHLSSILTDLGLNMDEFIDFCILCGCDYCENIKNVGPATAHRLIQKFGSIERVLEAIEAGQAGNLQAPPASTFPFAEARRFFKEPEVLSAEALQSLDLQQRDIQEEALKAFLITENSFNEQRVLTAIQRLKTAKKLAAQTRLDTFFGVQSKPRQPVVSKKDVKKRKPK